MVALNYGWRHLFTQRSGQKPVEVGKLPEVYKLLMVRM